MGLQTVIARVTAGFVLFAVTSLVLGEVVIRAGRIEPRVAIFRHHESPPRLLLSELHDRVVWRQPEQAGDRGAVRENLACEGAVRVHLYGDSIAFGAGLDAAESVGPQLQAALGPDVCVRTFAQPGSTVCSQLAFAMEHVPTDHPQVVIQQLWYGSPRIPTRLGDAAYDLHGLPADDAGYPTLPGGFGGPLHHLLFDHSRFWAWGTLALTSPCKGCGRGWEELIDTDLTALHQLTTASGGQLVLWLAAPLDRSVEDLQAHPVDWYDPVLRWAETHGVRVVRAESLWTGAAIEALRLNPCCHLNAAGAERTAQGLAEHVRPLLPPPTR